MKYTSQNDGILGLAHVKQGDIVWILEEAFQNNKGYWNTKVGLPNGDHKLAGVGGITGDLFKEAWGEETKDWINKAATVDIRFSNNTGNNYIVLIPAPQSAPAAPKRPETAPDGFPIELPPGEERIDPKDVPF